MPLITHDDEGEPLDGHCAICGCLLSEHHWGICLPIVKGCPCGKCEVEGVKYRGLFQYADVLPITASEAKWRKHQVDG